MRRVILLLSLVVMMVLAGCGKDKGETLEDKSKPKVGMVLNLGGRGDKSFNDSAYAGMERAKEDFDIDYSYVEPTSLSDFSQYLEDYAMAGYDLVVAIGYDMETPLNEVAPNYPDTRFVVVDAVVDQPNVSSVLFNNKEGAFIVGALSGLMTETDKIGYIGGIDMSFLNEFRDGYTDGAKYTNENIEVLNLYVGGSNPFNDPTKAKELALSLKNSDVDIIFAASGGSGRGLMEAVNENKDLYAIGMDSNQDAEVEGKVITSMMKRVDNAVYYTVEKYLDGTLENGLAIYGLKEDGVSTTEFEFTKDLIGEENLTKLNEIQDKIKSGVIVVD